MVSFPAILDMLCEGSSVRCTLEEAWWMRKVDEETCRSGPQVGHHRVHEATGHQNHDHYKLRPRGCLGIRLYSVSMPGISVLGPHYPFEVPGFLLRGSTHSGSVNRDQGYSMRGSFSSGELQTTNSELERCDHEAPRWGYRYKLYL